MPLICLLLPLYPIPITGPLMQIMQMQAFQALAVFVFLTCRSHYPWNFFAPTRIFVCVSFIYLLCFKDASGSFIFNIQMVLLALVIFERIALSKIDYSWMVNIISMLVIITGVYCTFQILELDQVSPIYFREENTWSMHGFWQNTAYCSTFVAMAMPFLLMDRHRTKWILIAINTWILCNCHASIAILAVAVSLLVILFVKHRRWFWILIIIILCLTTLYIKSDFGDMSSLDQRFYIWDLTVKEIAKNPIFGHGYSSFFEFGAWHIFTRGPQAGRFFPNAHNEYMNLVFEMGFVGLLFLSLIVGRICHLTFKYRNDNKILATGLGLVSFAIVATVQPVVHAPNTAIVALVLYGALENFNLRRKLCS